MLGGSRRTGVSSIAGAVKLIRRMIAKYGVRELRRRFGPEFAAAVAALIAAWEAVEALDNLPGITDTQPEDTFVSQADMDGAPLQQWGPRGSAGGSWGRGSAGGSFNDGN